MPVHLEFNLTSSQWQETTRTDAPDAIFLVIDEGQKKLIMTVPAGISMINRRQAERQARGITATGFQLRAGGRAGRL